LTVLDVFTWESLAIEVGQGLKGEDVVGALNHIRQKRETPKLLFCDNGSEFTSQIMDLWAYHNRVQIDYSRPGKPTDNAHVESFNGTLRAECLDVHWFETLAEAKQVIESWRREYNESRPHRSLGERTPSELTSCRKLTLKVLQEKGTDQNQRKSHYLRTKDGGQVKATHLREALVNHCC
jgi:putative transposase